MAWKFARFCSNSCWLTTFRWRKSCFPGVVQAGDLKIGAGLGEIRPGLGKLGVDIRRVDFREDIALGHPGADVLVPGFHVAAGARKDRRFAEGGEAARQDDLRVRGTGQGSGDRNGGNGHGAGFIREHGVLPRAASSSAATTTRAMTRPNKKRLPEELSGFPAEERKGRGAVRGARRVLRWVFP